MLNISFVVAPSLGHWQNIISFSRANDTNSLGLIFKQVNGPAFSAGYSRKKLGKEIKGSYKQMDGGT